MASNNGHRGKFIDRLFNMIKIRYSKNKKIKEDKEINNDKFIRNKVNYIRKRINEDNGINNRGNVIRKSNNKGILDTKYIINRTNNRGIINTKDYNDINKNICDDKSSVIGNRGVNDKDNDNFINKTIDNIRKKKNINKRVIGIGNVNYYKKKDNINNSNNKNNVDNKNKEDIIKELEVKIIKKIKNRLDTSICELDVLESEVYLLSQDNDKELELDKVKVIRNKIKEIEKKIEYIKEQYNILKNNYYFEDITLLDDSILIDDIINYKYMVNDLDDIYNLNCGYKLLDEYMGLYDKLSDVENLKDELVIVNNKLVYDYSKRDEKYNKIKDDIIKIDEVNNNINYEIGKQNDYMKNLLSKINIINRNEYNKYKINGIGKMISNSLKYIGLLLMSPFAGFIPSIAINTIATKKMIGNIRKNMKIENVKYIEYSAIDYDRDIKNKLDDINYVNYVVDDALNDVKNLKNDFMIQYNSNINGYESTLDKIEEIERSIVNNKKRLSIIKNKMDINRKINKDKLIKVKKLNDMVK